MSKAVAEQAHMDGVATLGCARCWLDSKRENPAVELHHMATGAGGRRDHMDVAPLCFIHHRGRMGIQTLGKLRTQFEAMWREWVGEHCPCETCKRGRNA